MSRTIATSALDPDHLGALRRRVRHLVRAARPRVTSVDTLPTPLSKRRTFIDPTLQANSEQDGYVDDDDLIRCDPDRSFYLSYTIGHPADTEGILRATVAPYKDAKSQ